MKIARKLLNLPANHKVLVATLMLIYVVIPMEASDLCSYVEVVVKKIAHEMAVNFLIND